MGKRHDRTLAAIFASPTRANIAWEDVVALVQHLGGVVRADRGGSMREFVLNGVRAIFHEPHPGNEVPQAMVRRLRIYLDEAGIEHS